MNCAFGYLIPDTAVIATDIQTHPHTYLSRPGNSDPDDRKSGEVVVRHLTEQHRKFVLRAGEVVSFERIN